LGAATGVSDSWQHKEQLVTVLLRKDKRTTKKSKQSRESTAVCKHASMLQECTIHRDDIPTFTLAG